MKFSVNLPLLARDLEPDELVAWAMLADQSIFSSLSVIDRLVYPNYEPLITLATVASVTRRIQLLTGVLISPTREVSLLAKQIATLDRMANGRLTIGLGVGNKVVDFQTASAPFGRRGKIMDEQVVRMRQIWSGQCTGEGNVMLGPLPIQSGGPRILFGGGGVSAARRVSLWGDGYISSGTKPESMLESYQLIDEAWKTAGRAGKPHFVVGIYYALGASAVEGGAVVLQEYYKSFLGAEKAALVAQSILTTPEALKETFQIFEGVGVDEVVLGSTTSGLDQLERLIEVIAQYQ